MALAYGVAALALYQAADLVTVFFQMPFWVLDAVAILLPIGLPAVLILSWFFVWTTTGVCRADRLPEVWKSPPRVAGYLDAFVLGVALFGVALWWVKPRNGIVARGAEVVAVLPFTVSGEGANHLAEGVPDLLMLSLEGTGVIRTANSRIVLGRHRETGRPGDLPAALALARDVGAGSVLTGSVAAQGTTLEVSATLHRADGWKIGEALAAGSADDLTALLNRLSGALIDDIWRSSRPTPYVDVGAMTTSSPEALNHYLRGEAVFRRGQWRAAANAFVRAVRADTTFALAYARLSDTYGWADGVFTENARLSADAAYRLSERLPARKRRVVVARWQMDQDASDRAPADTLQAILEDYPDDLEALHLLAEIGFHQRPLFGLGLEELMDPVERLLALDPTMTAGLIHPIETALQFGDKARFERYLVTAEATGLRQASDLRRVGTALWDAPETRAAVARELMADVGSAFTYTVRVVQGGYRQSRRLQWWPRRRHPVGAGRAEGGPLGDSDSSPHDHGSDGGGRRHDPSGCRADPRDPGAPDGLSGRGGLYRSGRGDAWPRGWGPG